MNSQNLESDRILESEENLYLMESSKESSKDLMSSKKHTNLKSNQEKI